MLCALSAMTQLLSSTISNDKGRSKGKGHMCIITEALEAYQSFCSAIPGKYDNNLQTDGQRRRQSMNDSFLVSMWLNGDKQNHHNRWWELVSMVQFQHMVSVLPLNNDSHDVLIGMVRCLVCH